MGSVIKKRRKRMAKKKHRKLLKKTRIQRRSVSARTLSRDAAAFRLCCYRSRQLATMPDEFADNGKSCKA